MIISSPISYSSQDHLPITPKGGWFLRILFVGDVFGQAGRRIVGEHLGPLIEQRGVDLVVVNAENAAGGFGVTRGDRRRALRPGGARPHHRQPCLGQTGNYRIYAVRARG